jgi:Domain of unknown function (DUF4383)
VQNLVHVGSGIAGIVLSARLRQTRLFGWIMLALFGAMFCYGLLVASAPQADLLNLNWADNWLHLALALVGAAVAMAPATPRRRRI